MNVIKKLKTPRVLFPFFMSLIMTTCMSFVVTFINLGFCDNFLLIWHKSFGFGFCVSLPVTFLVAPLTHKIVNKICK